MLNFLCIGAQKSGTTWLYSVLREHDKIGFPAGKEVHFWNTKLYMGIEWYRNLFDISDGKIHGEITPAYSILPDNIVSIISSHFPDLRLIYIIRNPIQRAWSSAKMALQRAEMTLEEASDQWFLDHFYSRGSIFRGDYEKCIRNWRMFFPKESLLILRFELIVSQPEIFIKKCLLHLGVNSTISETMRNRLRDIVFKSQTGNLRNTLYDELIKIYKDKINSLSKYLNEDFSTWLER